jgi:hypothetical protein
MNSDTAVHSDRPLQAVIVNITEQSYIAHRTYGTFWIAGRGAGDLSAGQAVSEKQEYSLTRVSPRTAVMDYGDKRTLPLPISAWEIANDICREINSDAGERSFLGVFVCAGSIPTDEELRGARVQLDEFYRALVAAADREWERSHSYLFIHDLQRRAAASLGLQKEWFYQEPVYGGECPGCGERVKANVAVCKSCGAILDREKALALGLVQPPAVLMETSLDSAQVKSSARR